MSARDFYLRVIKPGNDRWLEDECRKAVEAVRDGSDKTDYVKLFTPLPRPSVIERRQPARWVPPVVRDMSTFQPFVDIRP